jgi:hypothetical protein
MPSPPLRPSYALTATLLHKFTTALDLHNRAGACSTACRQLHVTGRPLFLFFVLEFNLENSIAGQRRPTPAPSSFKHVFHSFTRVIMWFCCVLLFSLPECINAFEIRQDGFYVETPTGDLMITKRRRRSAPWAEWKSISRASSSNNVYRSIQRLQILFLLFGAFSP